MKSENQEVLAAALEAASVSFNLWEVDYIQGGSLSEDVSPAGDNRPYVLAQIAGKHHQPALYDTGAMITVISAQIFEKSINTDKSIQLSAPAVLTVAKKSKTNNPVEMKAQTCYVSFSILGQQVDNFPLRVSPDLSSQAGCIIGIDLIKKLRLTYDASRQMVVAPGHKALSPLQAVTLGPQEVRMVDFRVSELSPGSYKKNKNVVVFDNDLGEDIMITPMIADARARTVSAIVSNISSQDVTVRTDQEYGRGRLYPKKKLLDISSILPKEEKEEEDGFEKTIITPEKKAYLTRKVQLGPDLTNLQKKTLLDLVIEYHQAFGAHEYDIGVTKVYEHRIEMKTDHPIYNKQFRLPDLHQEWLNNHVRQLLEVGVIKRSESHWNSPVFVVSKPSGGFRMILDLRAVNKAMIPYLHVGQPVDQLIDEVGKFKAQYFTTTDTLKGFFGMKLHPDSTKFTAFTLLGQGKFEYVSSPQGLASSPAGYYQLMDKILMNLTHSLSYLDDVITCSKTFDDHVTHLRALFRRMARYDLKLNIEKCHLGFRKVNYLGFEVSSDGVRPGQSKCQVIQDWGPPATKKQIQSFIGLVNYFRRHVNRFQAYASKLTDLTKKDSKWKGGELPADALEAFNKLKEMLISRPILRFPDYSREFVLSVDASTGVSGEDGTNHGGGLGAVLSQFGPDGEEWVIAYASRGLKKHENNYPAFLAENLACCFGIETFSVYLKGRRFRLRSDHKPLLNLNNCHKRTLCRLQELMNEYDFTLEYLPGDQNAAADFCSRALSAIESGPSQNVLGQEKYFELFQYTAPELKVLQDNDPYCQAIKSVLNKERVKTHLDKKTVEVYASRCFISEDHVLFYRPLNKKYTRSPILLFTPEAIQEDLLKAAHDNPSWGGHAGVNQVQSRLLGVYFWPRLLNDAADYVKRCSICQEMRGPTLKTRKPAPFKSYSQERFCNRRVHLDLVGPIKGDSNFSYALTMTCAYSKYVKTHPLKTKEGKEVATAFYNEWVCSFGCPELIVTDQGLEFLNDFTHNMMLSLGISHKSSLPYRACSNGQIEVFHKSLNRHLRAFMDGHRSNFSEWLKPLEFVHNTATSRATKMSPFCLFYTFAPRFQQFDQDGVSNLFSTENEAHQPLEKIRIAMKEARENNEDFRSAYNHRFNSNRKSYPFKEGQLVLLHSPLQALRRDRRDRVEGLNFKLARPWCGPCKILKVWPGTPGILIEFSLSSGIRGKFRVHEDRLKEYYLARNEPDPFLHPVKHKKWKAEQLGVRLEDEEDGAEPEGDGPGGQGSRRGQVPDEEGVAPGRSRGRRRRLRQEEVQPHRMVLRRRQGIPEQYEEDKVSLLSEEEGHLPIDEGDDSEEEEVEEVDEDCLPDDVDPGDVDERLDQEVRQWEHWQAPSRLLPRPVGQAHPGTVPFHGSENTPEYNDYHENEGGARAPEKVEYNKKISEKKREQELIRMNTTRTVMPPGQSSHTNIKPSEKHLCNKEKNVIKIPELKGAAEKQAGGSTDAHNGSSAHVRDPLIGPVRSGTVGTQRDGAPGVSTTMGSAATRLRRPWMRLKKVFYRK